MSEDSKNTLINVFQQYGNTYIDPDSNYVFEAVNKVRFDFNNGLRLRFPAKSESPIARYKLVIKNELDEDLSSVYVDLNEKEALNIEYNKKYFIKYKFYLYDNDAAEPLFSHEFNIKGKRVLIQLNSKALGDNLGWFPYYERFKEKYGCDLYVAICPEYREILEKQYTNIKFINFDEIKSIKPYASYFPGLFFEDFESLNLQPVDFRIAGLHKTIANILNVDAEPEPKPRFDLSAPRAIEEPYVCIAAQSSAVSKLWNFPNGWNVVVDYLKFLGYRVLCIDKEPVMTYSYVQNISPIYNAENFTGSRPLQERINLIKDADFFVGLSSGLSWLAWGCNVPVVMISGFTHPNNEFYTPYRVFTRGACNSCWNNTKYVYDRTDALTCPIKDAMGKGAAPNKFECTRKITPQQVIDSINKIPCVIERLKKLRDEAKAEKAESKN